MKKTNKKIRLVDLNVIDRRFCLPFLHTFYRLSTRWICEIIQTFHLVCQIKNGVHFLVFSSKNKSKNNAQQVKMHCNISSMNTFLLSVKVHLDGVINDKVSWTNRIYLLWITTKLLHCIPHSSKVHHSRDSTTWTMLRHIMSKWVVWSCHRCYWL